MDSSGPLHMNDQLESTYSCTVLIQDVTPKTFLKQWTIGREERVRDICADDATGW